MWTLGSFLLIVQVLSLHVTESRDSYAWRYRELATLLTLSGFLASLKQMQTTDHIYLTEEKGILAIQHMSTVVPHVKLFSFHCEELGSWKKKISFILKQRLIKMSQGIRLS